MAAAMAWRSMLSWPFPVESPGAPCESIFHESGMFIL
jgi:hypothetical protein